VTSPKRASEPLRRLVYACIIHDVRIFLIINLSLFSTLALFSLALSVSVAEFARKMPRSLERSVLSIFITCIMDYRFYLPLSPSL